MLLPENFALIPGGIPNIVILSLNNGAGVIEGHDFAASESGELIPTLLGIGHELIIESNSQLNLAMSQAALALSCQW